MALELTDDEIRIIGNGIFELWLQGGLTMRDTINLLTKIENQNDGSCREVLDYLLKDREKAMLLQASYHEK